MLHNIEFWTIAFFATSGVVAWIELVRKQIAINKERVLK